MAAWRSACFRSAGFPHWPDSGASLPCSKSALDAGLDGGGTPNRWFLVLCLLGVLNAAVAAAYYLRVVATIYFAPPDDEHQVMPVMGNPGAGTAALASALIVVGVGLFTGRWMSEAQWAARSAWFGAIVSNRPERPFRFLRSAGGQSVHGRPAGRSSG